MIESDRMAKIRSLVLIRHLSSSNFCSNFFLIQDVVVLRAVCYLLYIAIGDILPSVPVSPSRFSENVLLIIFCFDGKVSYHNASKSTKTSVVCLMHICNVLNDYIARFYSLSNSVRNVLFNNDLDMAKCLECFQLNATLQLSTAKFSLHIFINTKLLEYNFLSTALSHSFAVG